LNLLRILFFGIVLSFHHQTSVADAILPVGKNSLSLDAAGSVEWRQKERLLIATGKAVVRKGEIKLNADEITASYRDDPENKMEIYKITAVGNILITNKEESARGSRAFIDLEKQLLTIFGPKAYFSNNDISISANNKLEYFLDDQRAIARGGVIIKTLNEILEADQVEYDLKNQRADAVGEVRIKRGKNILLGGNATIDFKSGISRISGTKAKNSKAPGTVRGVIFPQSTR
jgi:lipopolysaccharide export system protein LptA